VAEVLHTGSPSQHPHKPFAVAEEVTPLSRFLWSTLPPVVRQAFHSRLSARIVDSIAAEHTTAEMSELLELDTGNQVFVKCVQVPPGQRTHPGLQLATEARVPPVLPHGAGPSLVFLLDGREGGSLRPNTFPAAAPTCPPAAAMSGWWRAGWRRSPSTHACPFPDRHLPTFAYCMAAEEPWTGLYGLNPPDLDDWAAALLGVAYREPDTVAMLAGNAFIHNAITVTDLVLYRDHWLNVLAWRHAQLDPARPGLGRPRVVRGHADRTRPLPRPGGGGRGGQPGVADRRLGRDQRARGAELRFVGAAAAPAASSRPHRQSHRVAGVGELQVERDSVRNIDPTCDHEICWCITVSPVHRTVILWGTT
jgi:hypothetical protein